MEAATRSVQIMPTGQRTDTGSSQTTPASIYYQQRIPSGASPIHRPVDTPQSYSKGGGQQLSQTVSRSAASPLSPQRQGSITTYPQLSDVTAREAPIRYVQQSPHETTVPFCENTYARMQQTPPTQHVEYHCTTASMSDSNSNIISISSSNTLETGSSSRPRLSLLHPTTEYMQTSSQQTPSEAADGIQAFKKIRFTENWSQSTTSPPAPPPPPPPLLKIVVREPIFPTGAYQPQVEAISPPPQNDPSDEFRATKDDLLNKICKIDMEITKAERTIEMLKNKEATLVVTTAKPAKTEEKHEVPQKHRSLAQKIYAENRKKASVAHQTLSSLGTKIELPLYNQPSDLEICKEIIHRHKSFKSRLLLNLKKHKSERAARNTALADKYAQLSQEWLRRIEKIEASAKRKAKDAKNREFFEKVFTELRKQREDKERFTRVGSRIKSEADLEEIMDGLQEQAMEEKKMRSYAVIPPLMLDGKQRKCVFYNENGSVLDMENDFKQDRKNLNIWTTGEKEIFKEKYLQHSKHFGDIAAGLDRKSAQDCVRYYYLSKKTENYKLLLRKSRQRTRSSRNPHKSHSNQSQCIVDALTTGVTTRLQREQQQQKTGGRDRAANSTSSNSNRSISPAQITPGSTPPPCSISSNLIKTNASTLAATSNSISEPSQQNKENCKNEMDLVPLNQLKGNNGVSTDSNDKQYESSINDSAAEVVLSTETINNSDGMITPNPDTNDECVELVDEVNATGTNEALNVSKTTTTSSILITSTPTISDSIALITPTNLTASPSVDVDSITTPTYSVSSPNFDNVTVINSMNGIKTELVQTLNSELSGDPTVNALDKKNVITHLNSNANDNVSGQIEKAADDSGTPAVISIVLNAFKEEEGQLDDLSESKKRQKDTSESAEDDDGDGTTECKTIDKLHPCFVCKNEEAYIEMRPLEKEDQCHEQYGIREDVIIPADAHICSLCRCKSTQRNQYTNCPLPMCPNPMDRIKRFRNLPRSLFELEPNSRHRIIDELKIPPNATKCCTACLIQIKRKLEPLLLLSDVEIVKLKLLLQQIGPKWSQLAESMNKTAIIVKNCYYFNKKKYAFDLAISEYYKLHPSEERCDLIIEGDESDLSTSSCDEHEDGGSGGGGDGDGVSGGDGDGGSGGGGGVGDGSDTASAESPKTSMNQVNAKKVDGTEIQLVTVSDGDRLLPPLGQAPRKQKMTEEYDSSATETADEENDNRQSPKVLLYPSQTTITMLPLSLQNDPRESSLHPELNVRDVMLNVIERSLKTSQPQSPLPPPQPKTLISNALDSRAEITFVRDYRNDITTISSLPPPQHHSSTSEDGLATLSIVNSQIYAQTIRKQNPHLDSSQIAATITPVQSEMSAQNQSHPQSNHDMQNDEFAVYARNEPESQTLDLSIKKYSQHDNYKAPTATHSRPIPVSTVTMYRSDPHEPSTQNAFYLGYQHEQNNRPSKSPSGLVQHNIQNLQTQVIHGKQSMQGNTQTRQIKTKAATKLSPKMQQKQLYQQHQSAIQEIGQKGSITHGTPVNSNSNHTMLVQGTVATPLSPRFDGILRQTSPSGDKFGSITQGTPVHLSDKPQQERAYEYYKNSRRSPVQSQQCASPQAPPTRFGSPYQVRVSSASGSYGIEQPQQQQQQQPQQLSSRQIIMNDFITSQQMHGQQVRGRSDNDPVIQSSRSSPSYATANSPSASLYYVEKEQRQRVEYLSRASPSEHINSIPSPHRTPPPPLAQRQGVIQRHNTSGLKQTSSPVSNRLHIRSPHHYPLPGHEALSSLVDVAVQQPLLPVPHKDDRHRHTVYASAICDRSSPAHQQEIQYNQQLAHEQMAMQMAQQQQHHMRQHQQQQQKQHQQQQHQHQQQQHQQQQQKQHQQQQHQHQQQQHQQQQHQQQQHQHQQHQQQQLQQKAEMQRRQQQSANAYREKIESERERDIQLQERGKDRRQAGGKSFLRDGQAVLSDRPVAHRPRSDGNLTAANLIDAIITHQISRAATEPPVNRDSHRSSFFGTSREPSITEDNGKSHSPNIINVDLDSDRNHRNQTGLTKSITLGELTNSIIVKDFSPKPFMPLRQPFMQHRPELTETWQTNRRIQHQQQRPLSPVQHLPPHNKNQSGSSSFVSVPGRSTTPPDERQIIRLAQSSSPRRTKPYHESITPSEKYQYLPAAMPSSRMPSAHQFALDCYVKNRIVEVMRTQDGKRVEEIQPDKQQQLSALNIKDINRCTSPDNMIIDEEATTSSIAPPPPTTSNTNIDHRTSYMHPHHLHHSARINSPFSQSTIKTFATATYAYPYSALNVSGTTPSILPSPIKTIIDVEQQNHNRNQLHVREPKPLLSAQYDALSDDE